jgi:tetratricopeptide (TPR) repeat protein
LAEKDTIASNRYINKFKFACKEKWSSSEADIKHYLAWIYWEESDEAYHNKAEEYFRKALSMEPEDPHKMSDLALFLIDMNRNLDDVQGLMDNAMKLAKDKVDYYNYSDTKGWALYKQGKYNEALEVLQKTWDEAPFKLYSIRSHLEEVKKAVAVQK